MADWCRNSILQVTVGHPVARKCQRELMDGLIWVAGLLLADLLLGYC